jgi:hypothetical protein
LIGRANAICDAHLWVSTQEVPKIFRQGLHYEPEAVGEKPKEKEETNSNEENGKEKAEEEEEETKGEETPKPIEEEKASVGEQQIENDKTQSGDSSDLEVY